MSQYWARFEQINNDVYRFDTRIYLKNIQAPSCNDVCVGAVVGKNPGSAKASSNESDLQAIELGGDNLLPNVKSIVSKAYSESGIRPPDRGFIQVLNLFYLCNANLGEAVKLNANNVNSRFCDSEQSNFPWVWYVWGPENIELNQYKVRFANINTKSQFFYNQNLKVINKSVASPVDFARHTQGLVHNFILPHLSALIKNQ